MRSDPRADFPVLAQLQKLTRANLDDAAGSPDAAWTLAKIKTAMACRAMMARQARPKQGRRLPVGTTHLTVRPGHETTKKNGRSTRL